MPNRLTRNLRSRQHARQVHILAAADAGMRAVDRTVLALWRQLLAALRGPPGEVYSRALLLLHELPHAVASKTRRHLAALYYRAHGWAARDLCATMGLGVEHASSDRESRQNFRSGQYDRNGGRPESQGAGRQAAADQWATCRLAGIHDPARLGRGRQLDDRGIARLTEAIEIAPDLFPAPPESGILGWLWRFVQPAPAIGPPAAQRMAADLAHQMASALSQGKTQQEVAKGIRPYLDGSRSRARRAARTFGLHVAHQGQQAAWDQLGGAVVGYQIHATKNPCPPSRQWHQDRDGTIYYRDPAPGQKGLAQCPHPPLEADDPAERPPGTPHIAWHCLCWLSPVFAG